ncbi:MAG: hypothetical protein ABW049_01710 [Spongiibacteraceae bacterium]
MCVDEIDAGCLFFVTAEGIENAAEEQLLKDFNCDLAQGYHYAKPRSRSDFEARWLNGRVREKIPPRAVRS